MSRRISFFAKCNPGKRRVRFPDEIVFEESIKESDGEAVMQMLRRTSLDIDVNRINMAGITALHQAVLDDNLVVVRLLTQHGADVNKPDVDSWTPLHAAAANGLHAIIRYLLQNGADRLIETEDGETALDLADPDDFETMAILEDETNSENIEASERKFSTQIEKKEQPAWFRKLSIQEESRRDYNQDERTRGGERRKGSRWVRSDISEEDEVEDIEDEDEDEDVESQLSQGMEVTQAEIDSVDNNHEADVSSNTKLKVSRIRRVGVTEQSSSNFTLSINAPDESC